ncbi:hypothetical protein BXQ17_03150 [Polaribacter sp. BM10]|uniref:hypothetical protein n=1 Tax=Polaribacter sp. BM10 TaxID=1529069 RepID=UPI00098A12C3|nr:hypothetical protein [Polaribacter sp. BM10]AQS93135.1 hypothetical protein BXQ17_03150 [Polaribacter sp. BM10]
MKKVILLLMIFTSSIAKAQEEKLDSIVKYKDTTKYIKSIEYSTLRTFTDSLHTKYTGKDFIYTEEKEKKRSNTDLSFLTSIASFLKVIFPFLLGGIVIFIILKVVLGSKIGFFNFKKNPKKTTEKLIYEEDDINELDLNALLEKAIQTENYKLAIRYYFLKTLKLLATKKLINYHKDKTNSEYKFELKKGTIRNQFSYLTYVYSYVWYGDFAVSKDEFSILQTKYESFIKTIS